MIGQESVTVKLEIRVRVYGGLKEERKRENAAARMESDEATHLSHSESMRRDMEM